MAGWLKRWRWAALVAALLVAGFAYAFWPQAQTVDVATVTRGPLAVGVTDDGVTRAEDVYIVSAPVTGYISRVEVEEGDLVAKGQVIARMAAAPTPPLDPRSVRELTASIASAEAARAGAETALGQARRDLARAQELSNRGFLPRAQLEAAQTRVASGQALLAQSRAEIARLKALRDTGGGVASGAAVAVRAPASGAVLSLLSESEGVVLEGTPIVTIGDPRRIEAVIDLLSREAVRVSPGDRVEFTQWGGDRPLTGRVDRVEPAGKLKVSALGIEEQRVNVIIHFDPDSAVRAARLGHGYQLDATIILWSSADALRVPIGALFRNDSGRWSAFVLDGGRARQREVRIGHINEDFAEVLGGLKQGDRVVLNPGSSIEDGSRVTAR
ncbi:membrane protein [Tsuneonella deserti]|uniref:Membrane protein n=1 Tax=Tsuneonella deserti TaxID=2035528 RepID=A0ABQ1RZQ3_9SPHN|nr:efflux RND transporter periplasmic adaptor subunit [Tsuneonella deserti]GGD88077.1 membrane protein [Tsuneonella deserti]